mgnify:CR=1 FL=1
MIFKKRLYFFSIGLVIGIFLVMFVFRGKNASFNYMPNARVIDNIISKDSIQFLNEETTSFKVYDIKEIILSQDIRSGDEIQINIYRNRKEKLVKLKLGKVKQKSRFW